MQRLIAVLSLCVMSGCLDWSALADRQQAQPAEDAAANPPAAAQPAARGGQAAVAAAAPNPRVPDMEAKIVDKQQALQERPQLFETTNKITANDPIFAPLQGMFAAGSKVEIVAFTHTIQTHKALNDKYPTFDEFMDYYRQANVKLKGLKPWQVYAYDESDGTIVILEDPQEKERIDKEWEANHRF